MPIKMKVCNVADYNESLKARGRIFHLFDEAIKVWLYTEVEKKKKSKYIYSNRLIEILAVFRYLFNYRYRQLQGLIEDYIRYKNLKLPVPNFTTLCRRMAKMCRTIHDHRDKKKLIDDSEVDVLLDSTGINIYHTGGGHSKENSRARQHNHFDQVRKMHVALNPKTKKVLSIIMSKGTIVDSDVAPTLLTRIPCFIGSIYADGAYDRSKVRKACVECCARQIIPPKKNAVIRKASKKELPELWNERNAAVRFINQYKDREEGRKKWKEENFYGRRSLIEAFFGKFKNIFGFNFMSRNDKSRESELATKIRILNSFSDLGGAVFKKVA